METLKTNTVKIGTTASVAGNALAYILVKYLSFAQPALVGNNEVEWVAACGVILTSLGGFLARMLVMIEPRVREDKT